MKRILIFFLAILSVLATAAQTALKFNHGDSISWYPENWRGNISIHYEQDGNGLFHQILNPGVEAETRRTPINHGDGIVFSSEPFIQAEMNYIDISNYGDFGETYDGEIISTSLKRSASISKDDITIAIETNNNPDWVKIESFDGVICDLSCNLSNYDGKEKLEAKVVFKCDKYNLTDTLTVVHSSFYLKALKREYHAIDDKGTIIINTITNIPKSFFVPENIIVKEIGENTVDFEPESIYFRTICIRHNCQLEKLGQTHETQVVIQEKTTGLSDTVSIVFHYFRRPEKFSYFYQASGDTMKIRVQTSDELEFTHTIPHLNEELASFLHRLPNEQTEDGYILNYLIDANNSDMSRKTSLRAMIGDSYARICNYLYQADKNAPSAEEQKAALTTFYEATNGDSWRNNDNWLSDKPLSEWYGIMDNVYGGNYVMDLFLRDQFITREFPEEVAMLMDVIPKELIYIDGDYELARKSNIKLNGNCFYGKIPSKVINHLRWQELGWNFICQNPYITEWTENSWNVKTLDISDCNLQVSNWEIEDLEGNKQWSRDLFAKNKLSLVVEQLPSNRLARLHLAYRNKGLGTVVNLSSFYGNRDECLNLFNEYPLKDIENTWEWGNTGELDGLSQVGSYYLIDSDSHIVAYFGRIWHEGWPDLGENLYISLIDSICRSRLGEPDEVDPDWSLEYYTSSDYSRDGEVVTLQKASVGRGIDLVFMGDAYVDRDMEPGGKYEEEMRQGMEYFFDVEPYKSLRDRFNVYLVKVVSPNEHIGDGCEQRLNYDNAICYDYVSKIDGIDMEQATVVNIVNDHGAFASAYTMMFESGASIAHIGGGGPGPIVAHEAGGHGFAKLLDEYIYNGEEVDIPEEALEAFRQWLNDEYHSIGWGMNVAATNNPDEVPWAHFLKDERYKDEIGIYQGAWYYPNNLWRPSENSIMNEHNYTWFNAPSREAIYKRVMQLSEGEGWTYDYEKFVEFDTPVREAYKQQKSVILKTTGKNVSRRGIKNNKPPTFYKGTWRDGGKAEPIPFVFSNKSNTKP